MTNPQALATHRSPTRSQRARGGATRSGARALGALALVAAALLHACGGGAGGGQTGVPGDNPAAGFDYPPGIEVSPAGFFVDPNQGGDGSSLKLEEMFWGRLVDVYDLDLATGERELQHRNLVIGESILGDGIDYLLESNPVTEQVNLVIRHKQGTADYQSAFDQLQSNLDPVFPKSLDPAELPPFAVVARNSALVLRFSDLVDHNTISLGTLKVFSGYPPVLPFEARLVPDPNHGGLVSGATGPEFRTTRVIVDTTVSELEALGGSVPVNSLGLPGSTTTAKANIALRIPTQLSFGTGQFTLLRNVSGSAVTTVGNGPVDFASPSKDVVRGMRSGGDPVLTGDDNNGFLLDLTAPRLVGAQPVTVESVVPLGDDNYLLSLKWDALVCAVTPSVGDVLQQPGLFAEVTQAGAPPQGATVTGVAMRLLNGSAPHLGQAIYLSTFKTSTPPSSYGCFLRFSPIAGAQPSAKIAPTAGVIARFSEPMDPGSVVPFDTFFVTRSTPPTSLSALIPLDDFVVAEVTPAADLKEFRFTPLLPFAHSGQSEDYFAVIRADQLGVIDLAGNPLDISVSGINPQVRFTIDPLTVSVSNSGLVLRFSSLNEDGDPGNKPEIRGQYLYDSLKSLIRPRPVTRFAGTADRNQAMVAAMTAIATGVQTPLSPLGSKLMDVYRYPDVGFTSTDESGYNVDIERMAWAPLQGQVSADVYEEFEMRLTHSQFLPDEFRDPASLLPAFPNSGLAPASYDGNILVDPNSPYTIVHPKGSGYLLDPLKVFTSGSNTVLMPWPMNLGSDLSTYRYLTWRDTSIRTVAAPSGSGIDLAQMTVVGLVPTPGVLAGPGAVPTIGLPLLWEIRCYPGDSLGLNSFDISIATNSSARPVFRLFSTGGINSAGDPVIKNPDSEPVPTGGFNQNPALGAIGQPTPGSDNVFYLGQLDFVYRVSRVHTIWFDSKEPNPDYIVPVLEPQSSEQPAGTSVVLAFRGAIAITAGSPALVDASALDAYGDQPFNTANPFYDPPILKNPSITFAPPPATFPFQNWRDTIDEIDGKRYFQMRISMINNAASGLSPVLSAVGIAWNKPGS